MTGPIAYPAVGELGQLWADAVAALGGDPERGALSGTELERVYSEDQRSYHDASHAVAVIRIVGELAAASDVAAQDAAILAAAAAAHDAVYRRRPAEDERDSAEWARSALLRCSAGDAVADRVARLILSTERHEQAESAPADPLVVMLSDADLSVLGGDEESYERYRSAVRREYAFVSDHQWQTGRAAVLAELLSRPRLFGTDIAWQRWEALARVNLQRELASLGG